jgi:hypothetical protein
MRQYKNVLKHHVLGKNIPGTKCPKRQKFLWIKCLRDKISQSKYLRDKKILGTKDFRDQRFLQGLEVKAPSNIDVSEI